MVKKLSEKTKKAKRPRVPIDYISYEKLRPEEQHQFSGAHMHQYLDKAYKQLFKIKDPKKSPLSSGFYGPGFDEQSMNYIKVCVKYVLRLIGKYSNSRHGAFPAEQHTFFRRKDEQEVFFTYLFQAIQGRKKDVISSKNPAASYAGTSPVNNAHIDLEAHNKKNTACFQIQGKTVSESDIYAAGIFYVMNFILDAIRNNEAVRLSRLLANMSHFGLGTPYHVAFAKRGGEKSAKPRNIKKDRAYALYLKHEIYKKIGLKRDVIAYDFMPILRRNRISVPKSTLVTTWLPAFEKKYLNPLKDKGDSER